jgi:hypothetical protein
MSVSLAERVLVLRDEVLQTAEHGDHSPPGAEVFDAIIGCLASYDATDPGLDLALHDALSRRLAWGDDEIALLGEADTVAERVKTAAVRALRDPVEQAVVAEATTEVSCTAARIIATAARGRAASERAALLREEALRNRLREALARQDEEIGRLSGKLF